MDRLSPEERAALASALRDRGLTLAGLSEASGVDPIALRWIIEGRLRPTVEIRQRLAAALGFDPRDVQ